MTHLAEIVETSVRVTGTRARLEKIGHLAECLRRLDPDQVEIAVAFLSGEMRQGKIGLGYAAVAGISVDSAATPELTLLDVDAALEGIQSRTGGGSRSARLDDIGRLFGRATDAEQQFLRRLIVGELRQGALEGVMMDAVAKAAGVSVREVRRAAMVSGRLAEVARAALVKGGSGLAGVALQVFRPLQPMLAQPAEDLGDALDRHRRAMLEWKLDGARIQVHRDRDDVRVFTRKLNDVTAAVPEIVEAALRLPVRSVILDGEAIAIDADGAPRPFQVTMRRFGRRLDVEMLRREIPIVPYFFDCLHVDGDDLIDRRGDERVAVVHRIVAEESLVPHLVTDDREDAEAFLAGALERGHEGIMVKALDAAYEAGRRGSSWLKVKPTHTLDLVVLAAEWGSGRRRGWLSNLHLGARDSETGGFVMLGKTFKGMTDEMLAWQTERLQTLEVGRDAYTVHVRPELVVEVAFDGVQTSAQYPGGVALRFARVKRYRPDKRAEDSDTIEAVRVLGKLPADS